MKKDVFWGFMSQFLQYGAALLVLPLLLRNLTSSELGIWYVFMTISALVTMLDMGFTPTLARNVSYVMGGARRLLKDGFEILDTPSSVDYGLLKTVIKAARQIFMLIAIGAILLLATLGSWYILHLAQGQVNQQTVLISWVIFVLATAISLYFKYYTPLLQGRGLYAAFYKSSAISNMSFVAVTAVLLELDLGLIAVSIGFLVSALVGRWLSWLYFYDDSFKTHLKNASSTSLSSIEIFQILWHNAWRMGMGVIGAFLILRANTLLSSVYLGLATTATYAMTLQVYSVLQSMSVVVFNVQQPKFAQYRVSNQKTELRHTFLMGLVISLGMFTTGAIALIYMGVPLIRWIGGKTELLPLPLLVLVGLMVLLELNHSLAAGVIVTGNRVPFVKSALLSGAAIVLISWLGLKYGGYGVAWLIGSQFLVQLSYNNWQWPWRVYRELYSPDIRP
ncbi:MAG: O-unit flippase-like protein [Polaromonas sp.]